MVPYPFQVSVHHVNAVHVLQSTRSIGQLNESETSTSTEPTTITHELDAINSAMIVDEIIDIAVVHPFGYYREPMTLQIHPDKR